MNGDFLRKKIENTGFQLVDIAEKLNISPQDLQSKLKAKDVKVSFLQNLAQAINKNVYFFLDDDEKTKDVENVTEENSNINGNNFSNKQNVQKLLPNENELSIIEEQQNTSNESKQTGVPLIPIDAMAGFGRGSTQVMDYDTQLYIVPEFTELKVDFMIRVKGSSMYPKYNSGDLVACKKLNINDLFFQWNKVYVLDTEQGALIKRIKKATDGDHILLVSDNNSYDPFTIHLSKVFAVALVIGVIRLE